MERAVARPSEHMIPPLCLAEYFKKDKHGREGWAHVEASPTGSDEKNPAIIKVDKKDQGEEEE